MKTLLKTMFAISAFAIISTPVLATDYTKGVVKKVDLNARKVTVKHEELKNLDMPAMTMVFRISQDEILDQLQVGQDIEFVAERIEGKLTMTNVR